MTYTKITHWCGYCGDGIIIQDQTRGLVLFGALCLCPECNYSSSEISEEEKDAFLESQAKA